MNINNAVYVRLTDHGREVLRNNHLALGLHPKLSPYIQPEEVDGLAKFQLWELMHEFGPQMYNGNPNICFERNEILFDLPIGQQQKAAHAAGGTP